MGAAACAAASVAACGLLNGPDRAELCAASLADLARAIASVNAVCVETVDGSAPGDDTARAQTCAAAAQACAAVTEATETAAP